MSLNPYQPPIHLETVENPSLWTRCVRLLHRIWHGPEADDPILRFILSGNPFFEYGVVFCVLPNDNDHVIAKMPLAVDDQTHRQRNVSEATRVLREMVARIDGLENQVRTRDLLLSMVPSYEDLGTELCRIVIPSEQWRGDVMPDSIDA